MGNGTEEAKTGSKRDGTGTHAGNAARQPAATLTALRLTLPAAYRAADILRFHGRDAEGLAERVSASGLRKGLLWQGSPAVLSVDFLPGAAELRLDVDGAPAIDAAALERFARRLLALTQPVEDFERLHVDHPQLGPLLAANAGLRVPLSATPFEALAWAVTGQQISVSAAISIRRRLLQACSLTHSSGLLCHPDAATVLALGESGLRGAGFSQAKAQTLLRLCEQVADGRLPLDDWADALPAEDARAALLAVKGIGPWTVSYALLRGFGWLDGSLHGDVALRRNLQVLLGRSERLSEDEARRWLADFSPWRALVAAHLWAMQRSEGY